jgi:hypothetical protein
MGKALKKTLGQALGWAIGTAFAVSLVYGFSRIWDAHVRASIAGEDVPGSEGRLIIAAILASAVTAGATALAWWDRRTALKNEREKKAFELRTEAAFEMWKAATTGYRLLSKAETTRFSRNNSETIQKAFSDAEKQTLLFQNQTVLAFQTLWQMSDELAELLVPAAGGAADQNAIWQSRIKEYASAYESLRTQLLANLPR